MLGIVFKYAMATYVLSGFMQQFLGFSSTRHRIPVAFALATCLIWAFQ